MVRVACRRSYWDFDYFFFDSELKDPEFHKEIIDLVDSDEKFVAVAAPRGHAKTTRVSIRHNLWLMLNAMEPYVLLVEDTYTQAVSVVAAIRYQVENNEKLRGIYKPQIIKSTEDDLIIETIYGRSRIVAKGTGQSLRGIIDERENRPTLIVCDDLEDDERVRNVELRAQDWEWFWRVLLPAMSRSGRVRVLGTIMHRDSLLNRLIGLEDWKTLRFSAVIKEGVSLWPEHLTYDELMAMLDKYRSANQAHTFYCEYLNNPIDPDNIEFKSEWIQIVSLTQKTLEDLIVTSTVDLAISKKEDACWTAITTCSWGRTNPPTMYVLDVRRGRWDVYETIEQLFKVKNAFGSSKFGIEKVAYQAALQQVFAMEQQRRQDFVSIVPLIAKGKKDERIRALFSLYARGQVKWARDFPELREEFLSFPNGVTVDCADSHAYQLQLNAISPDLPIPKVKKESGAALIDMVMKPRGSENRLGAY